MKCLGIAAVIAFLLATLACKAWGAEVPVPGGGDMVSLDGDRYEAWHRVELGWIRMFQGGGEWGWLMRGLSALGPGSVMWALIVALFFGGHPRLAARLAVFILLALWLRELLALALQSPRPYWLDPRLRSFGDVATRRATYGLPSGHAVAGTAFWFYLASEVRRPWAWAGAAVLALMIAMSRVYLGVHFVSDVVLGIVLGGLLTAVFRWFEGRKGSGTAGMDSGVGPSVRIRLAGLALLAVAMVAVGVLVRWMVMDQPVPEGWLRYGTEARKGGVFALLGGSFFGLTAGLALARPEVWKRLEAPAPWSARLARVAVAGAVGYSVAKAVQFPAVTALLPGGDGPVRWLFQFALAAGQGAVVWWILPRVLARIPAATKL